LYEVVKGARVIVKAAPNSTISVNAPASYNGRRFVIWQDSGKTDSRGIFSTVIPYATSTDSGSIMIQPCTIQVGGKESSFTISERAVINGETINLNY
jgi:hypothetical protein